MLLPPFEQLLPHAASSPCSGVPPIEAGVNPASWMLEVTSPEAERKSGADFALAFQDSELAREAQTVLEQCRWARRVTGASCAEPR